MKKVVYLGYSEVMLKDLLQSKTFDVILAIGKQGRLSDAYYKLIDQYEVPFKKIKNKYELLDNMYLIQNADLTIMYKFEYIIPDEIVKDNMIINFHGGELNSNRGAHAVIWSVLLEEKKTCLSCYRLTGGIDEGYLIDTHYIDILEDDNTIIVNKKLSDGIPKMLESIEQYLSGERRAKLITGGIYRRKIQKEDYCIDLQRDSINTMRAKILSQQSFDGAVIVIKDVEYRIRKYRIYHNTPAHKGRISIHQDHIDVYEEKKKLRMFLENE